MGYTQKLGLLAQSVFQDSSLNVGIGAAPSGTYKFEVTGTAKVSSTLLVSGALTGGGSITTSLSQATSTDLSVSNTSASNGAMAQISAINGGASQIDMVAFGSGSTGTLYGITKANLKVIRDNSLTAQSNGLAIGTDAAVPLYMFTNSSTRMTITSAGLVGIGTSSPASTLDTFVTRTSGGQVIAITLSDGVTGAQTDGGYKAIRSISNNGGSKSEIRFIEEGGTNNDTAIGFATEVNSSSLVEKMRISRGNDVTMLNKRNSSTASSSTFISTVFAQEKIYKLFQSGGTTSFDICTITSTYINGSIMVECVYTGQFGNTDQNTPSYKKSLVTMKTGSITVTDIVTQLTGSNIGSLNFTYVSNGVMKINVSSMNGSALGLNGIAYVRVVGGNGSSTSNIDPSGFTMS